MGEKDTKIEKIFVMDVRSGETFEFEPTKPTPDLTTTTEESADQMLKESVPDGINIHITGSQINKINSIDIYFKEEE